MTERDEEQVERVLRGTGVTREQYERRASERKPLTDDEVRAGQVAVLRRLAETFSVDSAERARLSARADELEGGGDDGSL